MTLSPVLHRVADVDPGREIDDFVAPRGPQAASPLSLCTGWLAILRTTSSSTTSTRSQLPRVSSPMPTNWTRWREPAPEPGRAPSSATEARL
jgi:hypothetical protein